VGVSVPMHTALRLGLHAAERIRRINPECHICFFGLYASLNEDLLFDRGFDSVIGGEFLEPLADWIETLARSRNGPVPGVSTPERRSPAWLSRPARWTVLRHGLPALERYARLERDGVRVLAGAVEASHGCLHTCLHCPITPVYRGRFFVVPQQDVLADIRALVSAGAGHITFADPDFLNGPRHSLQIVRQMHLEFPHLSFDMTTKVEHILRHRDRFPELRDSGCAFVVSAVESLSEEVLRRLEKGHGRDDVFEALRIVRGAGIELRPSFVAFTPWTRIEDYVELLDFIRSEDLIYAVDPVQLGIRLLLPPGSSLLDRVRGETWLGPMNAEALTHRWTHPDTRMESLHAQVCEVVERSAADGVDPQATFQNIEALARAAAGLTQPAPPEVSPQRRRTRGPRLTEDWFC
jgi:radical SAM superfamily enzyme YgiQ (UPF0313 family)